MKNIITLLLSIKLLNFSYVEGGELFKEILTRGWMNEKKAAYIIRQLLSAMIYCHSKGIVHRDLKPENILIDSIIESGKLNIKIIDFGSALFFTPRTKFSETLGTPYYIAPEVIRQNYNEKCDIWSIGVILYILLSGKPPFTGITEEDIMKSVKKANYRFEGKMDLKDRKNMGRSFRYSKRFNSEDVDLQSAK